eukprot:SAG11_NODE_30909_length_296_cov_1.131980_1_plen_50_part_01
MNTRILFFNKGAGVNYEHKNTTGKAESPMCYNLLASIGYHRYRALYFGKT